MVNEPPPPSDVAQPIINNNLIKQDGKYIARWFFSHPSEKYAFQFGSFPQKVRDENKINLKP